MERLFSRISTNHGVPLDVVRDYRLRRNRLADAAAIGIFALLYCCTTYLAAGLIVRRFGSDQTVVVTVAIIAVSLVMAWAGMMLGEVWSILMEVLRVGRGHLSYRTERIPWVQHRFAAFVSGVIAFWFIAALRYRRNRVRAQESLKWSKSNATRSYQSAERGQSPPPPSPPPPQSQPPSLAPLQSSKPPDEPLPSATTAPE